MFVACGIWCLADVSSVSPSSEQTGELFMHTGTCSCIQVQAISSFSSDYKRCE